jgi:predicted NBD/HSP70 family sugar kinase
MTIGQFCGRQRLMEQGTNLSMVAGFNRSVVLDAVRRAPDGVTRMAISDRSGLTPQAVSNIVARLVDDGLVREAARPVDRTTARGAPARRLELVGSARYAVGVHLDPAHVEVVLLDLGGARVGAVGLDDVDVSAPDRTVGAIASAVERLVRDAGVDDDRVLGIGLAVPGPIDETGTTLLSPSQLRGWGRAALVPDLARATGRPVRLEKDAVAGALGERWIDTTRSTQDVVYLYLGHGVSAGLVVGGSVVRGRSGNAGEFGDVSVRAHGGWGPLWRACQPLQLLQRADRSSASVRADPLTTVALATSATPADVRRAFAALVDRATSEDDVAVLLGGAGAALGQALAGVVDLLDVDRVVLGGSTVLTAARFLVPALDETLRAATKGIRPVRVDLTELGETAVACGAACAVLEAAFAPTASGLALRPRRGTHGTPALVRRDVARPL